MRSHPLQVVCQLLWAPPHHLRPGRHSVRAHPASYSLLKDTLSVRLVSNLKTSALKRRGQHHLDMSLPSPSLDVLILPVLLSVLLLVFSWMSTVRLCDSPVPHQSFLRKRKKQTSHKDLQRIKKKSQLSSESFTSSNQPTTFYLSKSLSKQRNQREESKAQTNMPLRNQYGFLLSFSLSPFHSF